MGRGAFAIVAQDNMASGKARRSQALHVIDQQAGGRAVAPTVPAGWVPLPGVPASREECRNAPRPCPFVRCEHHLWLVEGRDRRGRRPAGGELEPALQAPTRTTCALDVSETEEERSAEEVAELLGLSPRRVQQILRGAIAKLRSRGRTEDELLSGL